MNLTKSDLDVIMDMLDDMDMMWGLTPKEFELKEKIERWIADEQNN